jgi:hypothetical protein
MARSIAFVAALGLGVLATPAVADWARIERFETQAAPGGCPTCIQRLPGGGWRIADDEGGLAAFGADGGLLWRIDPRFDGARADTVALALAPDGAACLVQQRRVDNAESVAVSRVDAMGRIVWARLASATPRPLPKSHAIACRADGGATLALGDRVQARDAAGAWSAETSLPEGRMLLAAIGLPDGGLATATSAAGGGAPLSLQRYTAAAGLENERIDDVAPSTSGHLMVSDASGGTALARVRHASSGAPIEVAATRYGADLVERWRGSVPVAAAVFGIGARAQDDGGLAVSVLLDDATEGRRIAWWGGDGFLRWSSYFPGGDPQDGGNVRFAASADGTLWFAISRGAATIWRTDVRQVGPGGTLLRRAVIEDTTALGVRRIDLADAARVEMAGIDGIAEDPSQPVAAGTALTFGVGSSALFRGLAIPLKGIAQAIALDGNAIVGTAHADGPLRSTLRTVAWSLDGSEILRREQPFHGFVDSARSVLLDAGAVLQVAIDDPTQGTRRFVARRLDGALAWTQAIEETAARRVVDAWRLSATEAMALLDTGRLMRIALDGSGIVGQPLALPSVPQGMRRDRVGGNEGLLVWQLRGSACWVRRFDLGGAAQGGVDAQCPQFVPPPAEPRSWAARREDGGWILVTAGFEMFFQQRLRYLAYSPTGAAEAATSVDLPGIGVLRVAASPDGTGILVGPESTTALGATRLLRFDAGHALAFAVDAPVSLRPDGIVRATVDGGAEGVGFARLDGERIAFRLAADGTPATLLRGGEPMQVGVETLDATMATGASVLLAHGQSASPSPDRAGHAIFLRMDAPLFGNGFE